MRKVVKLVGILLVLVVLVAAAAFAYLRSSRPDYDAKLKTRGLGARVEVLRDSLGVPHIFAKTPEDMFYAQGYVHAQDRLWQMELFRRVAEGRMAEVLGTGPASGGRQT